LRAVEFQNYLSAFRQALPKLGWIEGGNIRIETRWGALDDGDSRQQSAKKLLALRPDVILKSLRKTHPSQRRCCSMVWIEGRTVAIKL
jgi:hypothetical protein